MKRETIRALPAWDTVASVQSVVEPGKVLTDCRIIRGSDAYLMEFQYQERLLTCPLPAFLPRTQFTEA